MIVKCERCQTRFKIPDEKVTEKGVKVRCTKCQNTFRVTREAAAAAPGEPPAPSSDGQVDPFARFGVAPDPKMVEVTKPGYFELGVEASRPLPARPSPPPPSWNAMDGDLDAEDGVFQEPTRVTRIPLPPAAQAPEPVPPPTRGSTPPGAFVVPAPGNPGRPPAAMPAAAGAPSPTPGPRGAPVGGEDRSLPPVPEFDGASVSPATARKNPVPPPPVPEADPFSDLLGPPASAGPAAANALRRSAVAPPRGGAPAAAVALGAMRPSAPPSSAPPAYGGEDPFASIDIDDAAAMPSAAGAPPPVENDPFASIDIDDAPVPAAAPGLPPPPGKDPFAAIDMHSAAGPAAAPGLPPPPGKDPFAAIDMHSAAGPAAAPGRPPPGKDPFAGIDIHAAASPAAAPGRPPPPGKDPFADIDIHAAASPVAAPGLPPPGKDPFAAVDIHAATSPAAAPALPPSAGKDPFASIDVHAPPTAAAGRGLAPAGQDPFASLGAAPAAAPGVAGPPGAAPFLSSDEAGGAGAAHGVSPGAALTPSANARDLFDLGSDVGGQGEDSGLLPTDTGRAALFGTSEGEGPLAADEGPGISLLGDVPPMEDAQAFGVTLGRVGSQSGIQREVLDMDGLPSKPVVTVAKPTARPEDVGIPQSRPLSRFRKVLAFTANLVLATALVAVLGTVGRAYLRDGRLDLSALSLDSLRALFVPAPEPLVAVDVTSGLYETRDGRSLLYVRGDAANHSDAASRIRVRAALYDGNQRVASAEALVGRVPTPEELYGAGSPEAASALRQRVDEAAVSVAPGAKAPFVVIFPERPADPSGFRLEVSLESERSQTAEAGRRME
ncbi:zinc-ribbon domain-containing protein [Corallococcus macrosporus]|uniref:Zinc finger/thioredoxin putative domain-containing protein n=1 Tax=Corallococcus macrosporus DSM 14697 TaxID=1189310 RepID=A0A250K1V7_9BACT|nr:zinc-ribbon domain-containing protein [Corallococcus macrosporus]ATB49948.1 hypothetical protein MYMAC_005602 [Corallococcus macrosporus DSM 14697]